MAQSMAKSTGMTEVTGNYKAKITGELISRYVAERFPLMRRNSRMLTTFGTQLCRFCTSIML